MSCGVRVLLPAQTCTVNIIGQASVRAMSNMDDATSLKIKEEIVAFDHFITNMQGETKKHVEALMSQ